MKHESKHVIKDLFPQVPVELSIFTHMTNVQTFDCDHLEM